MSKMGTIQVIKNNWLALKNSKDGLPEERKIRILEEKKLLLHQITNEKIKI